MTASGSERGHGRALPFGKTERHFGEGQPQLLKQDGHDRVFGAEVVGVDEIEAHLGSLTKLVVLDIGAHIGVAALCLHST